MSLSRRNFLGSAAAVMAGFHGLRRVVEQPVYAASAAEGYGPLVMDPEKILSLPKGFSYHIVSRTGDAMADGFLVPASPDGMAAFTGPEGTTLLVRNHELNPGTPGPFGKENELVNRIDRKKLYDAAEGSPGVGGTTTVVYDTKQRKVLKQYLSLVGTYRNCSGGKTPWGSWITCEESTVRGGEVAPKAKYTPAVDHGYNFEVPASADIRLVDPVPLKAMGRFNHEAVAVDPRTGIVYQTEDRPDGLLYRFVPKTPGKLRDGGKLQALKIRGASLTDTRNWKTSKQSFPIGKPLDAEWIDMTDVEAPNDDLRFRGAAAGAAVFGRGEGMWFGSDAFYFACTSGGASAKGQVFRYIPSAEEGRKGEAKTPGKLELFLEPNDGNLIENGDNLTVAPWGDLIICEDRSGDTIRLIGVTPRGELYTFAQTHLDSEFAGSCFSPDGSTLFVNIQRGGLTLAITGPWRSA